MGKLKTVILVIIMIGLVGGYYFYLSNKQPAEEAVEVTAVSDVLLRNLETNYPPTPKEVVKYYSDITKCLYNENYTDEQFEQMADKMLKLYDEELLENNPRDQYLVALKSDVDTFLENKYTITSYTVSASTDVETSVMNGREYAKLYCTYTIKSGVDYSSSREIFELRREGKGGHWKILGFKIDEE